MIETIFSMSADPGNAGELVRLADQPRRAPFEAAAVELISALSSRILLSPIARRHPELAAAAHWFRRANVKSIGERYSSSAESSQLRARGLVFTIAPANVEVLFIYLWLLSLLAGNASVVRLSQKPSPVREIFLAVVRELTAAAAFRSVLEDSWLITYGHDDVITARISAACDARLVWGGDATISHVRSISLNPVAVEAAYADRFSLAALSAEQISVEGDASLRDITRRFANDTLWFAQQACSSPRAVFWVGEAGAITLARRRFWPLYHQSVAMFENAPAAVMSRVTDLFMLAGRGALDRIDGSLAAFPARALGRGRLADLREIHSGHGLFVEYVAPSLQDVAGWLDGKDQTLVTHGFCRSEIGRFVQSLPNRAIDRIVAPGDASNFSVVWDGSDLLELLTRKVYVS
jgi:hypothetical protein